MSSTRSLRPYDDWRLPTLTGGLLAGALLVGCLALYTIKHQLMESAGHTLALAAGEASDKLDRIVFERRGDSQMMARAFTGRCSATPYISAYLEWMRQTYPVYESLSVLNAHGRVMTSTNAAMAGNDFSKQPWFEQMRDGRGASVRQWDSPKPAAQEIEAEVSFATAITDSSGIFCGVVMSRVDLAVLGQIVTWKWQSSNGQTMPLPSLEYQFVTGTGFAIVDSLQQADRPVANLRTLGVPSFLRAESQESGSIEETHGRRQVPVVTGFAKTHGYRDSTSPQWTVLLRVDRSTLLAPIYTRVAFVGMLGLIGIVPLALGLLWTARHLHKAGWMAQSEQARAAAAEDAYTLLAAIIESADDAIIGMTLDGVITSWNGGAERLFGYTAAETVGRPTTILLPPDRLDEEPRIVEGLKRGERIEQLETILMRKNGHPVEVSLALSSIKNRQGTIIGISKIVHDVTERKQREAAMRDALATLDAIVDGAFIFDPRTLRFSHVNEGAVRQTGYSRQELLLTTPLDIMPEFDEPRFRAMIAPLMSGAKSSHSFTTAHRRKDGVDVPVETNLQCVGVNTAQTRLIAIARDITERRQVEEHALGQRQLLDAANKELEAFSYSVSHDLRAPLRSIDGFSQALLEDCADRLNEQGRDHLNRIRAASQRMGQLIDDLLSLSRATRDDLRREPVDLSALALGSADELRKSWPGRQVELVVAPGLCAEGDTRLLQIVFDNLLGNAWKFTSKQERAAIEVGAMSQDGTTAYFVRDNGVGFDMAYVDKLFGAFQRLHAMTEYSGTGIGLATVKRIVVRHGGRVWAEGRVGQGATFYFTLGERSV